MLDTNGICERSNPALQAFFGRTGRELLDAPIFEWLHPDDMAGTTKSFDTLKGTGKPIIRYVNRCRIADGTYRSVSWVVVPERGRYHCTGRDVTPDREREAALAERTAERDRMWRASRDFYMSITLEGEYLTANPAGKSELGLSAENLKGMRFDVLPHPDDREATQAEFAAVVAGKVLYDHDIRVEAADGPYHWYSFTAFIDNGVASTLKLLADHADIDLVLTDQALPKMTGLQLATAVRAARPDLPIGLATGYAELPDGGAKLVDRRLAKPFSPHHLQDAVASLVSN